MFRKKHITSIVKVDSEDERDISSETSVDFQRSDGHHSPETSLEKRL
jgi:hypothetical protein